MTNTRGVTLSAKMDLLMKKLEDRANEKKEVMHIHDSYMKCEECGNIGHSGNNCPKTHEDANFVNNNYFRPQQNWMESTTKAELPR